MRLDPAQPGLLVSDRLLDLGLADAKHPSKLVQWRIVIEELMNLIQTEAEVPEGQQPVKPGQLSYRIGPVAGLSMHPLGAKQSDLVVVPKHSRRDLAEPCKISDVQHDVPSYTPSHCVKVKRKVKGPCRKALAPIANRSHGERPGAATSSSKPDTSQMIDWTGSRRRRLVDLGFQHHGFAAHANRRAPSHPRTLPSIEI